MLVKGIVSRGTSAHIMLPSAAISRECAAICCEHAGMGIVCRLARGHGRGAWARGACEGGYGPLIQNWLKISCQLEGRGMNGAI